MIATVFGNPKWVASMIAVSLAAGAGVAIYQGVGGPGTKVIGEKIQGVGSSSTVGQSAAGAGNGAGNNGNGNGGGGGNGSKSFIINGTPAGLYPGGTIQLQLTLTNPENQPMSVQKLGASLKSITKALGAADGQCNPTVTIGAWTGKAPFDLPKQAVAFPVPGYIPVSISHSAPDACQGALFTLNYSGTAVQK